eukprot:4701556-Karenia_brevis.AAC.1
MGPMRNFRMSLPNTINRSFNASVLAKKDLQSYSAGRALRVEASALPGFVAGGKKPNKSVR